MATSTLSNLVTAVRAEAGHALSASQGVNVLETLKYLIARTQFELWTAFQWPTLTIRSDMTANVGQYIYEYPAEMGYDQIRAVFYGPAGLLRWSPMEFQIPEECIAVGGQNTLLGPRAQFWDVHDETHFRIWPTPNAAGTLRLRGMKKLAPLVDDTDYCTLDPTLIVLMVSAELLTRAKASDAEAKTQKAQRHLQKLLGDKISAKNKVSTFGASRRPITNLRPGIDYIP